MKKNTNWGPYIKSLAKINGKDILPDVKMPRKKRSDIGKSRSFYDLKEKRLRKEVIKYLRKKGCKVFRIENSICGINNIGIPDLLFFHDIKGMVWCELKSLYGVLSPEQESFRKLCLQSNINHLVVKDLKEIDFYLSI